MSIQDIKIPARCSISSVLVFAKLKIYRAPGELPRLYRLKQAKLEFDPVQKKRVLNIQSHLVEYVGEANAERAYDAVACNVTDRNWITALYDKYGEVNKKGVKEPFENWWKKIFKEWVLYGDCLIESSPIDFTTDPEVYTMGYADTSQLKQGPHPSWDSFMSQIDENNRKVVMAFFWSIFEIENKGRQMLYLYDRGLTGKSDVANTFFSMLPHASGPVSESTFSTRFGYSAVYGHRLLIYPDCKVKDILIDEKLCSISGGDNVLIEYKGLGAFGGRVYAKVLIMSNQAPSVDTYRMHETSRVCAVKLDASKCTSREHFDKDGNFVGNNNFIKRLKEEFWYFMYDCKQIYPTMCPTNREIVIRPSERDEKVFEDMKSDHELLFDSWIRDEFDMSEDKQISGSDLYAHIRDVLCPRESPKTRGLYMREFKIYLEEKYNIVPEHTDNYVNKKRVRKQVYKGVGKKDSGSSAIESKIDQEDVDVSSCIFTKTDDSSESLGLENVQGV